MQAVLIFMMCFFSSATLASAKTNYMLQCQGCHKAKGEGIEGAVPDLNVSAKQMLGSEQGRAFFIQVPGSANSPLNDQELTEVLNYILTDVIGDTETAPYSVQEVTHYRAIKLHDVAAERAKVIQP